MQHKPASQAGQPAAIQVLYVLPDGERKSVQFTRTVRIGRESGCTLCLGDVLVSRHHAELYNDGSSWRVKDLGSSNGTYLNGFRIQDAELPPQATLQFGAEGPQIWVRQGDPGAASPVSSPAQSSHTEQPAAAQIPSPVTAGQPVAAQIPPPAATEIPPLTVTVQSASGKTYSRQFRKTITIGRDDHCTVRLNDEAVSRVHAELFYDGCAWCIRDLDSSNGTLLNGGFVAEARIDGPSAVQFGSDGPVIRIEPEVVEATTAREAEAPRQRQPPASIDDIARHYFEDRPDHEAGDHTIMVRRAFQQVKKKQKRRYHWIIAVVGLFLVASVGVGVYQYLKLQKAQQVAIEIFYNMKSVGLQVAKIENLIRETGGTAYQGEIQSKRKQLVDMERQYDRFLEEFGVRDKEMSEEDRIIIRMARLFGECELNMPEGFRREVKRYIAQWKQSDRLKKALDTLLKNDYMPEIYKAMVENNMPPQFMYLALQESNFNRQAVGPNTRFGIAKGMWQFIPSTARDYGLRTGPLVELPRYDPRDERFNVHKATQAAARFIRDIYNTDAQASGLLVMASYNWGPTNIKKRIRQMPENPRERNFWKLLEQHKVPQETYDYVFYIFSASVIGENPRLFGFDFDNPMSGMLGAG